MGLLILGGLFIAMYLWSVIYALIHYEGGRGLKRLGGQVDPPRRKKRQ